MTNVPPNLTRRDPPLRRCVAILVVIFAIMTAWTWLGWCDPIVDFGRELYVPWQLASGKVLYRDIAYFNGPLSPYFNALMFKCFGPSLRTIVCVNLTLLAVLTAIFFTLLSRLFDRFAATAACAAGLMICSFIQLAGVGNYNFVTPYSHEITHGLLLSVLALGCLVPSPPYAGERVRVRRSTPSREPANWFSKSNIPHTLSHAYGIEETRKAIAGFLLGLVFLTKIELFLAAAGAMALFTFLQPSFNGQAAFSSGRRAVRWPFLFVGLLTPPLVAFLLLRLAMPTRQALRGTLGSWNFAVDSRLANNPFYQNLSGLDDAVAHARHAVLMFAGTALLLTVLASVAKLTRGPARVAAILLAWLLAIAAFFGVDAQWWQTAPAGQPLLLLAIGAIQADRFRRQRDRNSLAKLSLTIFAILCLAKILLNVRFSQYGFALALPALLVAISFCLGDLPALIERGRGERSTLVQLCLPLLVLIIAAHLRPFAQLFADKPLAVCVGPDRFFARDVRTFPPDPRGLAVDRCLDQLRNLPPGETVAVVPEGAMISYLAKRVNPTKYINLMPPEVLMFGEAKILADFQQHPPDIIVLNDGSDPAEYGFHSFADYAPGLSAWIAANYDATNKATIPWYSLRLLRHRPSIESGVKR